MASQQELDGTYMACAMAHASLSKGVRAKVGAAIVTKTGIIIPGVNGLPKVLGNVLEDEIGGKLVTKSNVIHAEQACINKAAKEGVSLDGSTLYVSLSPCKLCAANMIAVGISRVVYKDEYRITDGLDDLRLAGIEVCKVL
jgi:dCMP deaminase